MLVREIMSSPAVTVSPYTTTREALRLLAQYEITALPALNDDGTVIGIVGEAELLATASADAQGAATDGLRVGDVMRQPAFFVEADNTIAEAVHLMTSAGVTSLPVVLHDRIVGVVSRSDLIRMLARTDEQIRYDVLGRLRAIGNEWLVDVSDRAVTITGPTTDAQRDEARELARAVPGVTTITCR